MRRTALALLLTLAAACSAINEPAGPVELRLANVGAVQLDEVVVGLPDGDHVFGTLAADSESAYRTVPGAYRYAAVRAVAGGEPLVLQPVDYVGETLLGPGRYTYLIGVDSAGGGLTLDFRRDD